MADTLVFCVALNHYDRIYAANLDSHRAYAERHGYAYALVNRPVWATVDEAVWLKLELLRRALAAGWRQVLFLDADCALQAAAPALDQAAAATASVCLAPGFSGNLNSGVILVRNDEAARAFLERVIGLADTTVPEQDWGENGHIIHVGKTHGGVTLLDRRWNNNADPALADFIRHYSAGGPMRPLYPFSLGARALQLAVRTVGKLRKWRGRHRVPQGELRRRLDAIGSWIGTVQGEFAPAWSAAERAAQGVD